MLLNNTFLRWRVINPLRFFLLFVEPAKLMLDIFSFPLLLSCETLNCFPVPCVRTKCLKIDTIKNHPQFWQGSTFSLKYYKHIEPETSVEFFKTIYTVYIRSVSWFHEGRLISPEASHRISLGGGGGEGRKSGATLRIAEARYGIKKYSFEQICKF